MITDPRGARTSHQIPDEAMWEIICNPTMPAPELAVALGMHAGTIRNARYRFRRHGWSCRVAFIACGMCGELVTVGGHVRRDRVYHPTCRPAAVKEMQRVSDKRRWEHTDIHQRNRLLDKAKEHDQTHQEATLQAATQKSARWTTDEEAMLIAHQHEPAYKLAEMLGRTLYAIRARQMHLRRRGLL